jgi:hypothetical protein
MYNQLKRPMSAMPTGRPIPRPILLDVARPLGKGVIVEFGAEEEVEVMVRLVAVATYVVEEVEGGVRVDVVEAEGLRLWTSPFTTQRP